ncbi:MAG: SDR family oxidoreductase [Alphaproteobacteria bacterium]|nr:SDR family oxidoreductase [Alphaproteobacteria bacterium]
MSRLAGKVAIITGAGSGIGRASAKLLAAEGAKVALVGRRAAPLSAVAREIAGDGGTAAVHAIDIGEGAQVDAMVKAVEAELGPVDILVNNAGSAGRIRNVRWIGREEWEAVVTVNLTAVYLLTQATLEGMIARGGGTIVTVSSLAAVRPNLLGGAPYGAAKAGVANFMAYLHNTFRNQNIRATTILPGEVDTPIMDTRPRPPTAAERAAMVRPEDVAEAVLLCCALPSRTVIEQLVIAPTRMRDINQDLEIARTLGAPKGAT